MRRAEPYIIFTLFTVFTLIALYLGLAHDRERLRIVSTGRCEQVVNLGNGSYEKAWGKC